MSVARVALVRLLLGLLAVVACLPGVATAAPAQSSSRTAGRALPFSTDYQAAVLADAPYDFWRLNEASGTSATDTSGNSRHATIASGTTLGSAGAFPDASASAMSLNGTTGHLTAPSGFGPFSTGLTLEAWIYPTAAGSWARIVDLGSGPANDNIVLTRVGTSTDLQFGVWKGATAQGLTAPGVLQLNTWQHVAATLDAGGNATLYYDGQRVAAGPVHLPNAVTRTINYLGRSNWSGDARLAGCLDEVAVYTAALSATRIQAHYTAAGYALPQPPTGSAYQGEILEDAPLAYWRLGEPAGWSSGDSAANVVAWDLTTHGHNATQVGGLTRGAVGALGGDANGAMTFNGTTGHLALPGGFSDFQTGLTIEAWIYPTAAGAWARVLDLGDGPANHNIIFTRVGASTDLHFGVFQGTTPGDGPIAPSVLQLNTWQHVAATMDAQANVVLYHNARIVATGRTVLPQPVLRRFNYIGRSNWSTDALFAGRMDEVALYATALPESRIRAHYQRAGYTPPTQPPASAYQLEVQGDAPSAYWRLAEAGAAGLAWDSSGQGRHGLPVGGVTLGAPGALLNDSSTAMSFDGVDDHIALPTGFSDFTNGLTIEAWIYPTAAGFWARIAEFGNGQSWIAGPSYDNVLFARDETSNDLSFAVYRDDGLDGKVTASDVLRLNVWQHVAVTMDQGGAVTIYYDGQRVATGTTAVPRTVVRTRNYIGRSNWDDIDDYFQGRMDEVAIFPRALSAEELLAHFLQGAPPAECSLALIAVGGTTTATIPPPTASGTPMNARCKFTGSAGQRLGVMVRKTEIGSTPDNGVRVSVLDLDGRLLNIPTGSNLRAGETTVVTSPVVIGTRGGVLAPLTLPVSATADRPYSVFVDPDGSRTGTAEIVLVALPEAPHTTQSYYLNFTPTEANLEAARVLGRDEGVRSRGKLPGGGVVILFFGQADIEGGLIGYNRAGSPNFEPKESARELGKRFAVGYAEGVGGMSGSGIVLVLATSNEYQGTMTEAQYRTHGRAWAEMVVEVDQFVLSSQLGDLISVQGGSDIELGWGGPDHTREWVGGYQQGGAFGWLYNAGDAQECPPPPHDPVVQVGPGDCAQASKPASARKWTQDDVWYVSWGAPQARSIPQIYTTNGYMSSQWWYMSWYAKAKFGTQMHIEGTLTQWTACQGPSRIDMCTSDETNNTTMMGWSQLWTALNSRPETTQDLRWSTDVNWP